MQGGWPRTAAVFLARRAAENTGELAILYRNHESALPLIDLLEKAGTPYTCRKMGHSFFSHPVVQDVKDLLAFAKAPQDRELFFKLYYKLRCGVTREMAAQAAQAMEFGATSEDIAYTCHAHPTHSEALKEAAMAVTGKPIHI